MNVEDFAYELPPGRIAQEPMEPRDHARLMVLDRASGRLEHRHFYDLPEYLRPEDALIVNESRVIPARLLGARSDTAGAVEVLLLHRAAEAPSGEEWWEVLVRPGRQFLPGRRFHFGPPIEQGGLEAEVLRRTAAGTAIVRFRPSADWEERLNHLGQVPLPPYIKKQLHDPASYQTVYAREPGSAAAPTAGLHFTPELLERIRQQGVKVLPLLLHVGLGTFRPVREGKVEEHTMHAEYYEVTPTVAATLNTVRRQGGRWVAVGTTVTRTLESCTDSQGVIHASSGWTSIFIYPGYHFKAVDALITNFHLPRSTLLMLVSALAGRERILEAYQEAIRCGYRFYSFGDAMLIL
ncbi:MAG: tRNA preQ1(34) S-adenosylmethionine ribosyltransferase-isomerase QueA [Limnochordaceae bacterium]|nr:tRNA preQ1(34) S-adenosylmethionine ribosyltransferase-isomerase QueA [Limnochordaceae bacterium]